MCFKSLLGDSNVQPGFRTLDLAYNYEVPHVNRGLLVCLGIACLVCQCTLVIHLVPGFLGFTGLLVSL